MTTDTAARVAAEYRSRVDRAAMAAGLPRASREALQAEVDAQLVAAIESAAGDSTDAVFDEIDRLGDPEALVEQALREQRTRAATSYRPVRPGKIEIIALVGICVGWLFFGYGGLLAIAALLWSRCWTPVDKLIGTIAALAPMAVVTASFSNVGVVANGSPTTQGLHVDQIIGPAIFVLGLVAPFFAAAYLWRRATERA